jgi:hypothetical protein
MSVIHNWYLAAMTATPPGTFTIASSSTCNAPKSFREHVKAKKKKAKHKATQDEMASIFAKIRMRKMVKC